MTGYKYGMNALVKEQQNGTKMKTATKATVKSLSSEWK
jgi:hypothetical protein